MASARRRGPTRREERLGAALRTLREQANLTQKEAADALDGDPTKISKIENGRQRATRLELLACLDLYKVTDPTLREAMLNHWRKTKEKQWWDTAAHEFLRPDAREMISQEAGCDQIWQYSNMLVPGLAQTPNYARAVIHELEPHLSNAQVESYVDLRVKRQQIFTSIDRPQFIAVLDEGLLRRPVGGAQVMSEQLMHLLEISRLPKTTIQVVPFRQAVYPGVHGPFRALLHARTGSLDLDTVEVSAWNSTLYFQDDAAVGAYRLLFDQIRSASLSAAESARLISGIARDLKKG